MRTLILSLALVASLAACSTPAMVTDSGGVDVVAAIDTPAVDMGIRADVRPDRPAAMGCRSATTCDACTAMQTCGWSISAMACLDGTGAGSDDGSSTGADWSWLAGMCPGSTVCQSQTACDTCTMMGCGWCFGSNHCLPGTATGSTDGTCTGAMWSVATQACPESVTACGMHSGTCDDCTMQNLCGFCPTTGTCLPGTSMGPFMGAMQAMCPGWSWQTTDCTAPVDAGPTDSSNPG